MSIPAQRLLTMEEQDGAVQAVGVLLPQATTLGAIYTGRIPQAALQLRPPPGNRSFRGIATMKSEPMSTPPMRVVVGLHTLSTAPIQLIQERGSATRSTWMNHILEPSRDPLVG